MSEMDKPTTTDEVKNDTMIEESDDISVAKMKALALKMKAQVLDDEEEVKPEDKPQIEEEIIKPESKQEETE
jgi:hypothetical protein